MQASFQRRIGLIEDVSTASWGRTPSPHRMVARRSAWSRTRMSRLRRTTEILETLVRFDTTSRNSNLELVAWVEHYLDRLGVAHERIADQTGAKANLWARIGPARTPGYILSGHTDVVP